MNRLKFQTFLIKSLFVILILSACGPGGPIPTAKPSGVRFEKADCMFGDLNGVDCGYLFVPEDRSESHSHEIKLAVAIIHSSNPNPAPDPVLVLFSWLGEPGSDLLYSTQGFLISMKDVLAERDVILLDRRGAGYSLPSLDCEELKSQAFQDAPKNLSEEESQRDRFAAYQACYDRLAGDGINLSAYTNAADVADINDLRTTLGYQRWNIYGDSYGARLALIMMRDSPEGIRSVILDSVYPLQENWDVRAAANAQRSLDLLFERCAADDDCNATYPRLDSVFYETVTQLDAAPISFELASQETHEKVTLLVNGDRLINLMVNLLSFSDALPYIPKWIYEFYGGNASEDMMLKGYMYFFAFAHEISSEGKGLAAQCSEGTNFESAQAAEASNADIAPQLLETVDQRKYLALCPAWDFETTAEASIQPVVSDIPTLLLSAEYDPGSPPEWATSAAAQLSHSHTFEFPGASFGMIYGNSPAGRCARKMISSFISDPMKAPDSSCVDNLNLNFVTQ